MFCWILNNTYTAASICVYDKTIAVCLVFLDASSGEGANRTELRNTKQGDLVVNLASECNNFVIVNTVGARIPDT